MSWGKIDDRLHSHPKFAQAGPVASWVWTASISWSNAYGTDGFIPFAQATKLATGFDEPGGKAVVEYLPHNLIRTLVNVGLWDQADGGYFIHDFFEDDRNKPAAWWKELREKRAASGRAGGQAKAVGSAKANAEAKPVAKSWPVPGPVPVPGTSNAERTKSPVGISNPPGARDSRARAHEAESFLGTVDEPQPPWVEACIVAAQKLGMSPFAVAQMAQSVEARARELIRSGVSEPALVAAVTRMVERGGSPSRLDIDVVELERERSERPRRGIMSQIARDLDDDAVIA